MNTHITLFTRSMNVVLFLNDFVHLFSSGYQSLSSQRVSAKLNTLQADRTVFKNTGAHENDKNK